MLNKGTKFLFDFEHPDCYPSQGATLAAGQTIQNLVDGAPAAIVVGNSLTYANKAIVFPGTSGNSLKIGGTTDYHFTNNSFLLGIWMLLDNNFSTAAYQGILGRASGTNPPNLEMAIDSGPAGGLRPRGSVGTASLITSRQGSTDLSLNVAHYLAVSWQGGTITFWIDGVNVSSLAAAGPLANPSLDFTLGTMPGFGSFKGKVFRCSLEDLTVSGKTAAAQVAANYAKQAGRFA